MNQPIAQKAGSALAWKSAQHGLEKGIYLLRLIVLAWLLSPDDFGLLAVSMVAIDVLTRLTDLGMIPSLVQRPTLESVHYDTAWTIGLGRALLVAGLVIIAAPHVSVLFVEPRATSIIRLLALKPVVEAAASIRVADLTRGLRFRELAMLGISSAVANAVVSIVLAAWLGVWALVAGYLAGPLVYLIISYVVVPYSPSVSLNRVAARSLIQFGRWIFLSGVMTVAASSALRWVVSIQLGTEELGLFFLATRFAFLPVNIASQVIGEVSFPLYSRLQSRSEKIARTYRSILGALTVVLIPICAVLFALTPQLVEFVLGPKWEGATTIIRILTVVSLIGLLGDTITPVLKGIGRPAKSFMIGSVQTLIFLGSIWIFTDIWGLQGAAYSWLPALLMSQIVGVYFLMEVIDEPFSGFVKTLFVTSVVSVGGSFASILISSFRPSIVSLIVSIVVAFIAMAWILRKADRTLDLGFADDLAIAFPNAASLFLAPAKKSATES